MIYQIRRSNGNFATQETRKKDQLSKKKDSKLELIVTSAHHQSYL